MSADLVACVDFGSTFTKAALVDVRRAALVARAERPTTLGTDVMAGWEACLADLVSVEPRAAGAEVLACSSAGGGLRIGVVGGQALVTAEAGRRVALSSGGRVVHVSAGGLGPQDLERLRGQDPDVLLLVGGTDGGNRDVLLRSAAALADARWPGPVVVAGNADARSEATDRLGSAGTPYVVADNVVPRIGVIAPESARRAIREMFLTHVIGGKHLSSGPGFAAMVRGATPDVVMTAVQLLAGGLERPGAGDAGVDDAGVDDAGVDDAGVDDVVVVDVGGATTDVYSVVRPVQDDDGGTLSREVVAPPAASRTVEGDLGVRWSAPSTVEEALAAGLLDEAARAEARTAAGRRRADPGYLPADDAERDLDARLAGLAAGIALRRHAGRARVRFEAGPGSGPGRGRWVERSGVDLREVRLLVGSGGALRHAADAERRVLAHVSGDGGWQVPEHARVVVDRDYVLAPAGLLAERWPAAAQSLLTRLR